MENEIVFDSSTNELQLLEFLVGDEYFGINIAKVSEIIRFTELTPIPNAPASIEGVFTHRDKLVTVIDLHEVLGRPMAEEHGNGLFIVCDFEQFIVAFHVSTVIGIKKLSWSTIEKPPSVSKDNTDSITTGMAKIEDENKIIMILDFEKIICDLNLNPDNEGADVSTLEVCDSTDFNKQLIIAEDSPFLCKALVDALKKVGFKNIHVYYNGADAWEFIKSKKGTPQRSEIGAIISDIEMPQMDGHTLTRLIKSDKELKTIPVFIFSSLIHENMRGRGDSAGADGQFARSELADLIIALSDNLKNKK